MAVHGFRKAASTAKVVMKESNIITKSWPSRLKHRPGEVGSCEEFDLLLASNLTGTKRYVKWRRE
jgi:hypothetical protein